METLEPVPTDPNKLRQMGKTVTVKYYEKNPSSFIFDSNSDKSI